MYTLKNAINGKLVASASDRMADVFNPATGEKIGQVPLSTNDEIDRAVENAKQAQPAWGDMPPARRARVMFRFLDLLNRNIDDLAREIS
ncbi:MAG TPA: aldehyde dehydrogenase family protein, partial [Devosia sp.]|nr:aldehyde dehydrogenase family protein [Devosia sp.]